MKAFEIFKPGLHTAASGAALSFSEADLEATVRAYDPAKHEAPIVVGHPKDNHPAYGWVGSLSFSDGAIVAEPKDVDPSFAEMVKAGRFKKRSASFYSPDHPANPVPGVYYLRHVGFLGAQPPAVKGLRDVAFSDADEGILEFEEDWYSKGLIARLFSGLRDWIIAEKGIETADSLLPKYAIDDLAQAAADARPKPNAIPAFNEDETMTPEQIAALQSENAELKATNAELTQKVEKLTADFSELQGKMAEAEKARTREAVKARIDGLVKAGKVTPAEVETLTDFACAQDDAAATFDFAEGDKKSKISARELFLKQLEARPVAVDFSERAGRDGQQGDPVVEAQKKLREQVMGAAAAK